MLRHDVEPGSHVVHFYADDLALASSVAAYAADGLDDGHAVVLIVTPAHTEAVRVALKQRGVEMGAEAGVHVLDAVATLEAFMDGGRPVPGRFAEVVGGALRRASEGRAGVRAYGEMVESLFEGGEIGGALELEELWNQLAHELPFSLYCAYHDVLFEGVADSILDQACRLHSAVVADGSLECRRSTSAHFDADGAAPAAARALVLEALEPDTDEDLADRAALTASELATNAVRHSRSGFSVTVTRLARTVRIAVRDSSPEMPVLCRPSPADLHGRGLHIVAALCRVWGTVPRPDGKVVWVELDR